MDVVGSGGYIPRPSGREDGGVDARGGDGGRKERKTEAVDSEGMGSKVQYKTGK